MQLDSREFELSQSQVRFQELLFVGFSGHFGVDLAVEVVDAPLAGGSDVLNRLKLGRTSGQPGESCPRPVDPAKQVLRLAMVAQVVPLDVQPGYRSKLVPASCARPLISHFSPIRAV